MVYVSGGTELIDPKLVLKHLDVHVGAKVGDLGCGGAGHLSLPTAQLVGQQGMVYSVDIRKIVLRSVVSRARLLGIGHLKTIWSNLEIFGATKIPEASLDFAFIVNVLFQSTKQEDIVREAVRLLKPAGKLLVIDWLPTAAPFGPTLDRRIKPDTIKQLAGRHNLKLVEEFSPGNYHFGLIFQK